LAAVLGARASAGDLVVTEWLNYPGIRMAAKLYNLRLKGLEIDHEGLIPDAFEAACRRDRPKILFCTPTLHNPTSAVMGRERRKEIAAIADRYGAIVIEDDICGLMPERVNIPIASLIPERTFYLTGVSKCLSAGVRIGYIVAPTGMVDEVIGAVQATTWIASPLVAAIVTKWVNEGSIDRILTRNRSEARSRQKLAGEILKKFKVDSHPASFHLWIQLPEPWRQNEFEMQARKRGLIIPSSDAFVIGRNHKTHSVRIGLGVADKTTLVAGLERLAALVSEGPQAEPVSI
jgi:DNA-binding transcriptional MocR family regulator